MILKQKTCVKKAVEKGTSILKYVPDHLKTQEMYNRVVEKFFFDHLTC